eukprot:4668855-Pyramimonas_sp.AAC.1
MLHSRSLIRWPTTPEEIATPFFVRKKDGRQLGLSSMRDALASFSEILLVLCWPRPRVSPAWRWGEALSFMRRLLTWTTASTESAWTATWAIIFAYPPFEHES